MPKQFVTMPYLGETEIAQASYPAGNPALVARNPALYVPGYQGDPSWDFSCLSVWVEGLQGDEIAIKNYSEGEGVLEGLLEAGVVTQPHRSIRSGFVSIPVVRLTEAWKDVPQLD